MHSDGIHLLLKAFVLMTLQQQNYFGTTIIMQQKHCHGYSRSDQNNPVRSGGVIILVAHLKVMYHVAAADPTWLNSYTGFSQVTRTSYFQSGKRVGGRIYKLDKHHIRKICNILKFIIIQEKHFCLDSRRAIYCALYLAFSTDMKRNASRKKGSQ